MTPTPHSSSAAFEMAPPPPDALVTPKSVRLSGTAPRCPPSDYHTDPILRHMTKNTRRMGRAIPVAWQNGFRDGGGFRRLADSLVTGLAIPLGALACPSAVRDFLDLSKTCQQVRYGDHESQYIDVFFPSEPVPGKRNHARARGMVFFVHGGAWGSGKPWFYRLATKPFLEAGLAVAVVGYRVYPLCGSPGRGTNDRGGVLTQVDDLEAALRKIAGDYPEWCDRDFEDRWVVEGGTTNQQNRKAPPQQRTRHHLPHLGTIVVGHSSGAHISMLWMVERLQKQRSGVLHPSIDDYPRIDALVGVSGVYNIGHHFDYEGGRGVEELSPLKPANGYDRKSFARHSPPWKVQHELLRTLSETEIPELLRSPGSGRSLPGRMLLVHGAEDDVVPFAGTGEAAKLLRACLGGASGSSSSNNNNNSGGGSNLTIDEFYVPHKGHEDTVVDLMMLGGHRGPVARTVVEWLLESKRAMRSKL